MLNQHMQTLRSIRGCDGAGDHDDRDNDEETS